MLKIGITGGIGSGKSTVCRIFESLNVPVFYADQVAKASYSDNPKVKEAVVKRFGQELYHNGQFQKEKLAEVVFNDKEALSDLNDIIHPEVSRSYRNWLRQHQEAPYTLKEAAILFESGSSKGLDGVMVVTAPEAVRIERVMNRDHLSFEEVKQRIRNQWPEEKLVEKADFLINNDGRELLIPQVLKIHKQLLKS